MSLLTDLKNPVSETCYRFSPRGTCFAEMCQTGLTFSLTGQPGILGSLIDAIFGFWKHMIAMETLSAVAGPGKDFLCHKFVFPSPAPPGP